MVREKMRIKENCVRGQLNRSMERSTIRIKLRMSTIKLTDHMKPKKKDHTKVWLLQSYSEGERKTFLEVEREKDVGGREERGGEKGS